MRAGRTSSSCDGDVLDEDLLRRSLEGCDAVFHFAANADVRHGLEQPRRDLEQNTIATSVVLEAMRAAGVTRIAFASTGSVYGEPAVFPTPETARSRCRRRSTAPRSSRGKG